MGIGDWLIASHQSPTHFKKYLLIIYYCMEFWYRFLRSFVIPMCLVLVSTQRGEITLNFSQSGNIGEQFIYLAVKYLREN